MYNTPSANMPNTEINPLSYAKAIISCFALFFPKSICEQTLTCSSFLFSQKEYDETKNELINMFDPTHPKDIVKSLISFFFYLDNKPLNDLRLVKLFDILFSNRIAIVERSALISTFRALRESYCKYFPKDHDMFDTFISNSYDLYCESVTNSERIEVNFLSNNYLGALTQSFPLSDEVPLAEKKSNSQNLVNYFYCEKAKFDWKAKINLKTKDQKIRFLSAIYDGLKSLTLNEKTNNMAILTFPNPNDSIEYFSTEDGKAIPIQCTKNNFIAMFDGVVEEKPTRTIISASGDCLSKFIDAMGCIYGNRNPFAKSLGNIIVQSNGKEFSMNTLQHNGRNSDCKDCYQNIIESAYKNAINI